MKLRNDKSLITRRRIQMLSDEECIKLLRNKLQSHRNLLLNKSGCLEWCFPSSLFVKSLTSEKEKEWGKNIVGQGTNQWTTMLGEHLLRETLELLNENPRRIQAKIKGENGKTMNPDWETDMCLYECKTRTYTTTGTAGEKILGAPWKYSECFNLYKKPLKIVCIAYQEEEAEKDFCIFNPSSPIRKSILDYYYTHMGIEYVKFTDILKQLATKLT